MKEIATIMIPIYERGEEHPAFEHAVSLAKTFKSRLLVTAVIRKRRFFQNPGGPPAMIGGIDEESLSKFRSALTEIADRLVRSAREQGLHAQTVVTSNYVSDAVIALTQQCDLLVESEMHREAFFERLLNRKDIYTDSHCPIMIPMGEPSPISHALLLYNQTKQANNALRWLTLLAENGRIRGLSILVICHNDEECNWLPKSVTAFVKAHGLDVHVESVMETDAFRRTIDEVRKHRMDIVAIATYTFHRPFRLGMLGIDMKALNDIQTSVLLFP